MADVPGKFYRATKVRTGVAPSSAGSIEGEVLPPVNPPGSSLNSVGLTMPSAFTVSNSPLTANGTIGVAGAGTVGQYIRGDGSLADFPQTSGGGSSVSYYLNGSVDQGTIGGIAYKELSKVPILGAGTDFTINADGYIASFITDAGDPSLLEIPGGNWNFETYFSASSSGGTPTFYVELYKVSGTTATLIASSSSAPEFIAFGTNLTPYFSTLAVPTTTLALTDRLAVRYYVTHSGRTITLHTENNHLCQIITTFTTGLTALNGLTAQVQNFAVGTTGTDFNISSATATHTFNLPTASATNRGALSSADWSTFNAKQPAGNYVTLDTTQTITGQKTISRVASSYNGTVQSILIDGPDGNGALTINSNGSSPFAYQTFAQGGIGKFELGVVGTSGNGSFYINRTTQTGETGASIYIKKSDGFVGINNITPTFQLDVGGNGKFSGSSTVTGKVLIEAGNLWSLNADQSGAGTPAFAGSGFYVKNENTSTIALGFNTAGEATFSNTLKANTTTITNGTRSWIISPSGASINHEFAGVIEGKIDPSSGGNSWFGATSGTTGAGAKHYFASNGAATFASTVTASSFIRVGGTSSQFLKADGSVDSTSYLPLGGGTMTGPITTPNGTFGIVIGDDSRLADRNVANTLFLEGIQNNDRGYINFSQTTGNALGAINGGDLTWRGSTVWTSANITPVTSVTASSPLASSGGTTPNITIQQASGSQSGFLSSTDWNTFNNKQNAGNYVTLDTTQTITAAKTFSLDIIVNGVNVGRGGGNFITSTRVGVGALQANTTGEQNTAVGESALLVNTTGSNNSSFGRMSLFSNTSGSANTAIGTAALNSNTIGIYNSGFGFAALGNNTTGNYNTGVGNFAGTSTNAGSNNTTSSDSVYIGYDTRASASGNTNEIVIGSGGRGEGSNTAVIGNSSITKTILRTNLGVGTNGPATFLHVAGTSAKALTGLFHTCIQDFTSMATGVGGGITFMGYKTAQSAQEAFAGIDGFKENGTAGNAAGAFRILTQPSSGAGLVEQIRFTSDGYTRLSSTAGGIQFNGDTAAANALDDYEEGEFSPTIIGSSTAGTVTYNARNGLYTKIGRAVSFNLYVDWSSGTGSGNLRLSGLPFTASATGVYPAVAIGEISAIALSANTIATARVQISTNEIWFGQAVVGGGFNSSLAYDGAGYIVLSGTYYI